MIKASFMYPNEEGARFDLNYYCTTHMDMAVKAMKPYGLVKTEVEKGISGGGDQPAPYVCIGSLYFDSLEAFQKATAEAGGPLGDDVANLTDIAPIFQLSEVIKS